ncbi:MAG: DUF6773 family protein [Bacillota bacterium]|nr:DUF6773 family protein [Bacillota bacterium]
MNNRENNLDEMQEQKLLKIERNGAWFAFWGLLATILMQVVIGGENLFRNIVGEWIIFMCLAAYMGVSCMKNGIWDRHLQPNGKTNIIVSLVAGSICGSVFFISSYLKFQKLFGSIATGVFIFIGTFALALITLTVSVSLYKKRVRKLEEDSEAQFDDTH